MRLRNKLLLKTVHAASPSQPVSSQHRQKPNPNELIGTRAGLNWLRD